MNILDHRILIPTAPETVWEYISDIARNPSWQADCKNVTFVSTRHSGAGTRWRYDTGNGHEYVVEITTWYDKLGYEYTFVDGAPYRESTGRIRLQEIAEGTIVQWSFNYEMGGILGGVRNAVATKRQIEGAMVESLRSLWSAIQKSDKNVKPREAKSLLREGLDYEARSNYKPRHASNKPETPDQPVLEPVIVEPPISDEDTRPGAAVKLTTSVNEPVFLSDLPKSPAESTTSTAEHAAATEPPPVAAPPSDVPETAKPSISPQSLPSVQPDELSGDLASTEEDRVVSMEEPEPVREMLEVSAAIPTKDDTQENLSFTTTTTTRERPPSTDELVQIDTSEVSIFDVFGVPRPSETQEMAAINFAPQQQTATLPMEVNSVPQRVGLRLKLRQTHIKLRRPV